MKKDVDLRRIMKTRDDIRKGEAKEREVQEYLKTQRELLRQQEILGDETEEEEPVTETEPVSKMYEEDYENE